MLKEITIRDTEQFLELIGEIECGSHINFQNEYHLNWLKKKIKKNFAIEARYFAFEKNEKNIGILCLLLNDRIDGKIISAEILEIGIFKQYRNQGFGSELLKLTENYCRKHNIYMLGMFTYAADFPVISYYGKNGFAPVAVIPDVHGPGDEGKIFMRKILE